MRQDQAAQTIWQPPNADLLLPLHEVHVWRAALDQPRWLSDFFATLAPDEKNRAARFHFQKDREHFIAARGLLRRLLSGYLKVKPHDLAFGYSAHGKPFLLGEQAGGLRFNVSHSHGLALFAFV